MMILPLGDFNQWHQFAGDLLYIIELNVEELPGMTLLAHIIELQCLFRKTWHTICRGVQILFILSPMNTNCRCEILATAEHYQKI